jgi:serine/threonine protein kinase
MDLKPDNMLVDLTRLRLYVSDLGLAKERYRSFVSGKGTGTPG